MKLFAGFIALILAIGLGLGLTADYVDALNPSWGTIAWLLTIPAWLAVVVGGIIALDHLDH